MINFLWVAVGGAVGATMRFLAISSVKYIFPSFPIGTLVVNIIGSFFIGFLMGYLENKNISSNIIKYFFIIGIFGSFTTFSTFSFDVVELIYNKRLLISFFYIFISIITCLFFCFFGYNFNRI